MFWGERGGLVVEYRNLVNYLLSIGSSSKQSDAVSTFSYPLSQHGRARYPLSLLAMSFICCKGDNPVKFNHYLSHLVGEPTMWFPNRFDTNRLVQAQKRARSLKFRI